MFQNTAAGMPAKNAPSLNVPALTRREAASRLALHLDGPHALLPDELVTRPAADLVLSMLLLLTEGAERPVYARVTRGMLHAWDISEQEAFAMAEENAPRLLPPSLAVLSEILQELAESGAMQSVSIEAPTPDETLARIFRGETPGCDLVLSNIHFRSGAAAMFYPGLLRRIAGVLGSDLYLLPSSVHEVILVPVSIPATRLDLARTVQEINRTVVREEDRLSDRVYVYRRETDTFS
ncbi:MAG: hypothetical protein IJL66_04140 [Lachnospiraceae bacterium]|nr:hypothetical protein [Lachnospiraceae bacterium]